VKVSNSSRNLDRAAEAPPPPPNLDSYSACNTCLGYGDDSTVGATVESARPEIIARRITMSVRDAQFSGIAFRLACTEVVRRDSVG